MIINKIKKINKALYHHTYFNQKDYFAYLNLLKKKIEGNGTNKKKLTNKNFSQTEKIIFELNNKKSLTENDYFIIEKFYNKFSVFLSLKKKYNRKLVKTSNLKCINLTYLIFGILLFKLNEKVISKSNKLNTILKIIDLSILKKKLNTIEEQFLKKNIINAFRLIKKLL